jgi:membrane-associated phospholipid phosphatase
MDLSARAPTVERVTAGYNLLLAGVWIGVGPGRWTIPIVAAHLVAAALPVLFDVAVPRRRCGPWTLRDLYPMLLLPALWTELGLLRELVGTPAHDAAVAALDRTLFGVHLNAAWAPAMPWRWLSETMQALYFGYYLVAFGVPLILVIAGRHGALRDAVLCMMTTYLACYVIYIAFPVDGPAHTLPRLATGLGDGFFHRLNDATHAAGDSAGTAFPSSHVAGVVTMALVARRWFSRPVALLFALVAGGVCLATVYTQNHYPTDVLAALALTAAIQGVVVPALHSGRRAWPRRRSESRLLAPEPSTGG